MSMGEDEATINLDLPARFDRATISGAMNGPLGETVRSRMQRLSAINSAAVGSRRSESISSQSSTIAPSLRTLVQTLSSKEAAAAGLSTRESASAAQSVGEAYQAVGDFETALEYYHQTLASREFLFGLNDLATLNTYDKIAAVFELQSRWQDALEYYQQSLLGRERSPVLGSRHPSFLPTKTKVARMLHKTGESEEALQEYQSILSEYQRVPNGGSAAALAVQVEMALVQFALGNRQDGLETAQSTRDKYQDLLGVRQRQLGPNHRLTNEARDALQKLEALIEKNRTGKTRASAPSPPGTDSSSHIPSGSTPLDSSSVPVIDPETTSGFPEIDEYERKLAASRNIHGDNHPDTLELMCNLASAYSKHEQYEPAVSWYQEALRGGEITFGRNHPTTLEMAHNLGECYSNMENYTTALVHLDRALKGRTSKLSQNHPDTLDTTSEIATVHQGLGDIPQAIELMNLVVSGYETKYGDNHSSTLSAKFKLAKLYGLIGSPESERLHAEVLQKRREKQGRNHPFALNSLVALAMSHQESGDNMKAIPLLVEAYAGQKTHFGPLHSTTTDTVMRLAQSYWATSQLREALEHYLLALEGIQHSEKKNITAGAVTMSNIGLCYARLEEHQEAFDWYEKVFRLYEKELGKDHEKTIDAVDDLAQACMELDKYDEAIHYYQMFLSNKEEQLPDSNSQITVTLFQLALATFKNGQNERSLEWSDRLLSVGDSLNSSMSLVTIRIKGQIYSMQGKNDVAMELYQQVLEKSKIHLPGDHWLSKRILEDISNLYLKIDKDTDIVQDLQRQREVIQQLLENNEETGILLLSRLGDVHARQHLQHEALSIYEETLDAIQCSPESPDLIRLKYITISNIADTHLALYNNHAAMTFLRILIDSEEDTTWRIGALIRMGSAHETESNFDEALINFKQVLRETERKLGPDSGDALRAVRKIGELNLQLGNIQEAQRWTQRAVNGFRRSNEDDAKVQELVSLQLLSHVQLEMGELQNALVTRKRCAEELELEVGVLDEKTLNASLHLANLHDILENYEDALLWYRKAVGGYKTNLGERSANVTDAEQRIRELEERSTGMPNA
jgi:tetratricopeptide (TPR) repeat protein